MRARDILGARELFMRVAKKRRFAPTSTPFSALMRMQKGHRAYRGTPLSIKKTGVCHQSKKCTGHPSIESDFARGGEKKTARTSKLISRNSRNSFYLFPLFSRMNQMNEKYPYKIQDILFQKLSFILFFYIKRRNSTHGVK